MLVYQRVLVISGDSRGKATIFWEKNNDITITNLIWYDDAVLWVCREVEYQICHFNSNMVISQWI